MSINDYVKFVTEQLVMKMEQPREKRKEEKVEKPPFSYRAFGVIPLAVSMLFQSFRRKRASR